MLAVTFVPAAAFAEEDRDVWLSEETPEVSAEEDAGSIAEEPVENQSAATLDRSVSCWMDGVILYWRGDEEDLDYYSLDIWEANLAINEKLFRVYYYPKSKAFYIVTVDSSYSSSSFKPGMRYDATSYVFNINGTYQVNPFDYFNIHIYENYEYCFSVEAHYTDGDYVYDDTNCYKGSDLINGNPISGKILRQSQSTYPKKSVTYDYYTYNVDDPKDLRFQWQRTLDPNAAWDNIQSAASEEYVVQDKDMGYHIRLVITAVNHSGALEGEEIYVNEDIEISEAHFPDAVFREALRAYDNDPEDGRLSSKEIAKIKGLSISGASGSKIGSIEGIGYLKCLTNLSLPRHNITEADLTELRDLKVLNLSQNSLNEDALNISNCHNLQQLHLENNRGDLERLFLTENTELTTLNISGSGIRILDLRKCRNLRNTALYGEITDVDGNIKIPGTPGYSATETSIFRWNGCALKIDD